MPRRKKTIERMNSPFQFTFRGKPLVLEDITPERLFEGVLMAKIRGEARFAISTPPPRDAYRPTLDKREDLRDPIAQFLNQTKPQRAIFVDIRAIYGLVEGEIEAIIEYGWLFDPSVLASHPLPTVAQARTVATMNEVFNKALRERGSAANPKLDVVRYHIYVVDFPPHWTATQLGLITAFKESWTQNFREMFRSLVEATKPLMTIEPMEVPPEAPSGQTAS
jgi:hypothetical protein